MFKDAFFIETTADDRLRLNQKFETELKSKCSKVLLDEIDQAQYLSQVHNQLWDGHRYVDRTGEPWYYIIPKTDTKTGKSCIINVW